MVEGGAEDLKDINPFVDVDVARQVVGWFGCMVYVLAVGWLVGWGWGSALPGWLVGGVGWGWGSALPGMCMGPKWEGT